MSIGLIVRTVALQLPLTVKHERCGGVLFYVCLAPLQIKDTKAHYLFCCLALFVCRSNSRLAIRRGG
jgi:hypothetical protein